MLGEKSEGMSDTGPVVRLKEGMKKINKEIREMVCSWEMPLCVHYQTRNRSRCARRICALELSRIH